MKQSESIRLRFPDIEIATRIIAVCTKFESTDTSEHFLANNDPVGLWPSCPILFMQRLLAHLRGPATKAAQKPAAQAARNSEDRSIARCTASCTASCTSSCTASCPARFVTDFGGLLLGCIKTAFLQRYTHSAI